MYSFNSANIATHHYKRPWLATHGSGAAANNQHHLHYNTLKLRQPLIFTRGRKIITISGTKHLQTANSQTDKPLTNTIGTQTPSITAE